MSDVTVGYGRLSDLYMFICEFSNIFKCLKRYIFIKLSLFVCQNRIVEMKSKSLGLFMGYISLKTSKFFTIHGTTHLFPAYSMSKLLKASKKKVCLEPS